MGNVATASPSLQGSAASLIPSPLSRSDRISRILSKEKLGLRPDPVSKTDSKNTGFSRETVYDSNIVVLG
jgi:hypothetical protein